MISLGCECLIGRNWCPMCAEYGMSSVVLGYQCAMFFFENLHSILFYKRADVFDISSIFNLSTWFENQTYKFRF